MKTDMCTKVTVTVTLSGLDFKPNVPAAHFKKVHQCSAQANTPNPCERHRLYEWVDFYPENKPNSGSGSDVRAITPRY